MPLLGKLLSTGLVSTRLLLRGLNCPRADMLPQCCQTSRSHRRCSEDTFASVLPSQLCFYLKITGLQMHPLDMQATYFLWRSTNETVSCFSDRGRTSCGRPVLRVRVCTLHFRANVRDLSRVTLALISCTEVRLNPPLLPPHRRWDCM